MKYLKHLGVPEIEAIEAVKTRHGIVKLPHDFIFVDDLWSEINSDL